MHHVVTFLLVYILVVVVVVPIALAELNEVSNYANYSILHSITIASYTVLDEISHDLYDSITMKRLVQWQCKNVSNIFLELEPFFHT